MKVHRSAVRCSEGPSAQLYPLTIDRLFGRCWKKLSQPELMAELGQNALRWAERFEREKILGQYEDELKRLVGWECQRKCRPSNDYVA